jgi:hypothetical protein
MGFSPTLYDVIVVKIWIQSIAKGLIFWFSLTTLIGMARPKKDPSLRMDTDLRIPLTGEQKAIIDKATADVPEGKAAWARAVLLEAARKRSARNGAKAKSHA